LLADGVNIGGRASSITLLPLFLAIEEILVLSLRAERITCHSYKRAVTRNTCQKCLKAIYNKKEQKNSNILKGTVQLD
jgi:hypothetical protein